MVNCDRSRERRARVTRDEDLLRCVADILTLLSLISQVLHEGRFSSEENQLKLLDSLEVCDSTHEILFIECSLVKYSYSSKASLQSAAAAVCR